MPLLTKVDLWKVLSRSSSRLPLWTFSTSYTEIRVGGKVGQEGLYPEEIFPLAS